MLDVMSERKLKVIVISGSINSGKTTTSKHLVKHLVENSVKTAHVHGDSLRHFVTWQDLEKTIPITHKNICTVAKNFLQDDYDVVIDYPFYKDDFESLCYYLDDFTDAIYAFVLSPSLDVAQSQRGARVLSQHEIDRIAYHYQTNLHNPDFGITIDNSMLDVEETVALILTYVNHTV